MSKEKKKILIVDDEMDMRIYISTVFKISGYLPTVTREGQEGIQKAKELHPDLIILDVMMPGEGGVEMYRRLKETDELKHIPVIMLSAVKKETYYHYLKMLNARQSDKVPLPAAYIEKPFEPEELIATAQSVLA